MESLEIYAVLILTSALIAFAMLAWSKGGVPERKRLVIGAVANVLAVLGLLYLRNRKKGV
jgi:hypothetical protein